MLFDQDTIKQIQAIAFDAYKTTGRVAALLDGGGDGNRSLAQEMSAAAFRLERGTVAFRRLCEQCQTLPPETAKDAPPPAPLDLACWWNAAIMDGSISASIPSCPTAATTHPSGCRIPWPGRGSL